MAETALGIQATLLDYFQDTEYFDLQEANELLLEHQNRDVKPHSIRARIYEGIDKGLFERVGKGLYTVTRTDEQGRENTCLLINGDGRDLSMIPSNSISGILTDHPYQLTSSLKGGNRNFANYELFQYNEQDFKEKQRVLKPGCFLVEFLPEENGDNYQYLFQVKELARKAGLEYYAKVPWKKGDFVANTGRKSKNTEDICFFTKGRARELRPDAKKTRQILLLSILCRAQPECYLPFSILQPPLSEKKFIRQRSPLSFLSKFYVLLREKMNWFWISLLAVEC